MRIREAHEDDCEAAMALYRELSGDYPAASDQTVASRWEAVIGHPGTTVYGAEAEGRLVAIATLHVLPNMTFGGQPYALVENVVTTRRYQGKGVGRRVMERVIAAAWAAGAYKIMLLPGQKSGARGFYEKLGFNAEEKFGMTLRRAPERNPGG